MVDELSTDYSNLNFDIDRESLDAPALRLRRRLLQCTLAARIRRRPPVDIIAEMAGEAHTVPVLLIRGGGGIGKTALALELIRWRSGGEGSGRGREEYTVLSEMMWSNIRYVLDELRSGTPKPPHMYSAEDGAFVIDWITEAGRVACILRDRYAHVMAAQDDEIVDRVFEGDNFSIDDVVMFLKKVAAKAK